MKISAPSRRPRKLKLNWKVLTPLAIALLVLAEISYLTGLDLGKNSSFSVTDAVFHGSRFTDVRSCENWLSNEGKINYSRDFITDPVLVSGSEQQEWSECSVGCRFGIGVDGIADATFNAHRDPRVERILRSMESSEYYIENRIDVARGRGYNIIMTTSLSSDIPVGYFSWTEYDFMAPLKPKNEKILAAAFISNCNGNNFRLKALEMLEESGVKIDSYGSCLRNRDGNVDKVETLKKYKFSLAFENSNEEDYVTEKFFQSLVAGTIPVVVGAPNIHDFAPCSGSVLNIKSLDDVASVAKIMNYLSTHPDAFNHSLRWKKEGPSDSFKALVDMSAVHSSCRLCIHIATKLREKEEKTEKLRKRPCKCRSNKGTVYNLFVRERGRFEMQSIFLMDLSMGGMEKAVIEKFRFLNHTPIWKNERPGMLKGDDNLKIYKIYPLGFTQRQALFSSPFRSDSDFSNHVKSNPCAKFEVIFV
ncbi:hypothetical protein LUZ60_005678 [Juncus effusus]|nr:hypothetical protein LUZ60_005678 [Juncus effusus]